MPYMIGLDWNQCKTRKNIDKGCKWRNSNMYCVPATASVAQVQFLIADLVILHY